MNEVMIYIYIYEEKFIEICISKVLINIFCKCYDYNIINRVLY